MKIIVVQIAFALTLCGPGQPTAIAASPVDYQVIADNTKWPEFEKLAGFSECFAYELRDYQVQVTRKSRTDTVRFRILDDNSNEVYAWDGGVETPFVERNGILYYALYWRHSSGCEIVAYDLKQQKHLWRSWLQGIGPVFHSIYGNEVRFGTSEHKEVLKVFGRESFGRYVEIVDLESGKTVGHKQFPAENSPSDGLSPRLNDSK